MKKNTLFLSLSGLCLLVGVQAALAAPPPPKPAAPAPKPVAAQPAPAQPNVPMSTVLQNLKMNGYDIVTKVDLDKDVFKIDAMTPQGKEVSITMNAKSGEINSPKENPIPHVTLPDAVKRVEGSGYHDISMVEFSGSKYIIKTLDQKDKKVKLKVDGNTGEITKAWF